MTAKRILPGILTAALLASTAALAQSDQQPPAPGPEAAAPSPDIQWDKKRLDRLERNVERLENTIAHMKPQQAPPNLIEPDPEVVALEGRVEDALTRVGDLENALKRVNGQLDQTNLELDKSHRAEAAARADADALRDRVAQLESKLTAVQQAQAAAPQQPGQPGAPGDAAAQGAQAPSTGDPAGDFKAAIQLMRQGEYDGAGKALHDYLDRYPNGRDVHEAHYQLGELSYMREAYSDAAPEYVAALKGWPKTRWAPDALEKLSETLDKIHNRKEACAAVGEFERRYAKEAAAPVKARASALRTRAKCAA